MLELFPTPNIVGTCFTVTLFLFEARDYDENRFARNLILFPLTRIEKRNRNRFDLLQFLIDSSRYSIENRFFSFATDLKT